MMCVSIHLFYCMRARGATSVLLLCNILNCEYKVPLH